MAFAANWYDPNWNLARSITIDPADIDSDLTNYILFVNMTKVNLGVDTQTDCGDIIFVDSTNVTKFYHDVEMCKTNTDVGVFWVTIPNVSSTSNTKFFMYYSNPNVVNQEDENNTWAPKYAIVLHLNQTAKDSSGYGNDGTLAGPTSLLTPWGYGRSFDGVNDSIDSVVNDCLECNGNKRSFQTWLTVSVTSGTRMIFQTGTAFGSSIQSFSFRISDLTPSDRCNILQQWSTTVEEERSTASCQSGNTYHYIYGEYDKSSTVNEPIFYYDGVPFASTEKTGAAGSLTNQPEDTWTIGENLAGSADFTGKIGYFHFLTGGNLTGAEIKANYECQRKDGTCITVGNAGTEQPIIVYDNNPYFIGHGAIINITHLHSNTNPNLAETIPVTITSTTDTTGLQNISFMETGNNTGIFASPGYIMFQTTASNPSVPQLKVSIGDTVTTKYNNKTATATVVSSSSGSLPIPGAQPDFTQRYTCSIDADADAICDDWEDSGLLLLIEHPSVGIVYEYWCSDNGFPPVTNSSKPLGDYENPDPICPSPAQKDIFVEVDWLSGHKPSKKAIDDVIASFAAQNIALHVQLDEDVNYHNNVTSAYGSDYFQIKSAKFGTAYDRSLITTGEQLYLTAKRQAFHYALFIHNNGFGNSGEAELLGNDFYVSLGPWAGGVGTADQQAGTFMHELGHNLDLHHGGADAINCKPNYLSIMSYSRQFSSLISNRPIDYSQSVLPTLNENSLSESAGVGASTPPGLTTVYGPPSPLERITGQAFDWNRDGDTTDTGVIADINYLGAFGNPTVFCPSSPVETLNGYNDWANLDYNFRLSSAFGDGAGSSEIFDDSVLPQELTYDDVKAMRSIHLNSLNDMLQNLPDSSFANKILTKNALRSDLMSVDNMIKSDGLYDAINKLKEMRKKVEAKPPTYTELVTDHVKKKIILDMIDDLEMSLRKDFLP